MVTNILEAMHKCTQGILSDFELIKTLESGNSDQMYRDTSNNLFNSIESIMGYIVIYLVYHIRIGKN